ncbi:hypothetical protein DYB32_006215 [Aphanomyces invadans]|uniref:Enoyl reductase (ER) domain-containing protein n=1 Tax=Aphanomyces invadans TaxID=157072 RepID=A0A418AYQ1_9STRA|nr:hypothetical protein DYB32_006215 [Aphanomyces invadans]
MADQDAAAAVAPSAAGRCSRPMRTSYQAENESEDESSTSTMQACYYSKYGKPSVVQIGSLPRATLVAPDDILVRVHAASINPIDYKRREGAYKLILESKWPNIVGYDMAGVVVLCGTNVKNFHIGDEVYACAPHDRTGTLAEYVCRNDRDIPLHPYQRKCLSKMHQAKKCVECVKSGGIVASIADTPPPEAMGDLQDELNGRPPSCCLGIVLGCLSYSMKSRARARSVQYTYVLVSPDGAMLAEIAAHCESGVLRPVIDKVFPFAQALEAMELLESGHVTGKIVIEMPANASGHHPESE